MNISLDELTEITHRLEQSEAKVRRHEQQVIDLKNILRSILHHPRSGEKLRRAAEIITRIEAEERL
jgi:hypothetical protein